MPSNELQDGLPRQLHQVQLVLHDDVQRVSLPAQDAELAEVVSRTNGATRRAKHLSLAAEDDVEGLGARSVPDDGLASGKLGERRVPNELAQLALADAREERERCKHVRPVAVARVIVVAE